MQTTDKTTENRLTLIERAFTNQDMLNQKLRPDWKYQNWKYYRAVWTEIAEAIGHTNWYWWKTGEFGKAMTKEQLTEVHIELCDIFHFGISLDILSCRDQADLTLQYLRAFEDADLVACDLEDDLEAIVVDAILLKQFSIKKFARACKAAGLGFEGLMVFYFGKSTLNEFRWRNGYNEKKYTKMWAWEPGEKALEDNTHLGRVLSDMSREYGASLLDMLVSGEAVKEIDTWLEESYDTVIKTT